MKTPKTAEPREELDGELAGLLTAISIVSKRLATKLTRLQAQMEEENNG